MVTIFGVAVWLTIQPENGLRFIAGLPAGSRINVRRARIGISTRLDLAFAALEIFTQLCGQSLLAECCLFGFAQLQFGSVEGLGWHLWVDMRFLVLRRGLAYGTRAPVAAPGPARRADAAVAQW